MRFSAQPKQEREVKSFDNAIVSVATGLKAGEVVVTAGVQALRPGQRVRLLEPRS